MTVSVPSLGSQLDSARAKLARADEHISELKQAVERFSQSKPHVVGAEPYEDVPFQSALLVPTPTRTPSGLILPPSHRMVANTIALRITLTPRPDVTLPALQWGAIVGEIVHHLASALDNLVHELTLANVNQPPIPLDKNLKDISRQLRLSQGFPSCKQRSDWSSQIHRYLYFVDRALDPVFERAQPFYAEEQTGIEPARHPATMLRELWNADKHRTVNLTAAGLRLKVSDIRIPSHFPDHGVLPSEIIKSFPTRPIEGTTEVMVVRVHLPGRVTIPSPFDVRILAVTELALLFGEGAPGEGENALDVLDSARGYVSDMLRTFA